MTAIFYKTKPLIGLDVSRTGARVIAIDHAKKVITGYGSTDFDQQRMMDENSDISNYLEERLQDMLANRIIGKLPSNRAAVAIPTAKTYARTFSLPVTQAGRIKEAVNLEVEQYVPLPLSSLYVDYQIIRQDDSQIVVLMCAVPQKAIDELITIVEHAGLEVALVEPSITSIARLMDQTGEGNAMTVLVDIGTTNTDIAIVDSAIRVTGALPIGGNTFTSDIAKKLNTTIESAHQLKTLHGLANGPKQQAVTDALRPSLGRINNEIQKVIRYYTDRFPSEKKPDQLLIVGSGANIPGIGEYFTNSLVIAARVASPWQSLNFGRHRAPNKTLRPHFMTAAGLALVTPMEAQL